MIERLQEFVDSSGAKLTVDREHGVIKGVKVLGLESRNGRTYLPEAVEQAAKLYEGAKVNVNHPAGNPTGPRDYRDRLGSIQNVTVDGNGLRGDFHFNPKHAVAEQLIWDAEHAPKNVGFSHNVEARCTRKGGKTVVEEITRVQSVDLVADPATTRGLFESTESKESETMDLSKITEADLRSERPDLLKAITEAALASHADSEEAKAKDATIKALTDKVAALESAAADAAHAKLVEGEIAAAKLPASAVTEVFKGQLLATKDAAVRKSLIEDRQKFVGTATRAPAPTSKEQKVAEGEATPPAGIGAKAFADAITE